MKIRALCVLAGVAVCSAAATADIVTFTFGMDGLQENPPVVTTGSGIATVILDTVSGAVSVTGTYDLMLGTVNNAHIHGPAAVGSNGPVIVGLSHTGGTSGTISGAGVFTAAQVADMLNGLHYVNVHSTFKSSGEIRGQVVPAPAAAAFAGLFGIAAIRRRR